MEPTLEERLRKYVILALEANTNGLNTKQVIAAVVKELQDEGVSLKQFGYTRGIQKLVTRMLPVLRDHEAVITSKDDLWMPLQKVSQARSAPTPPPSTPPPPDFDELLRQMGLPTSGGTHPRSGLEEDALRKLVLSLLTTAPQQIAEITKHLLSSCVVVIQQMPGGRWYIDIRPDRQK